MKELNKKKSVRCCYYGLNEELGEVSFSNVVEVEAPTQWRSRIQNKWESSN